MGSSIALFTKVLCVCMFILGASGSTVSAVSADETLRTSVRAAELETDRRDIDNDLKLGRAGGSITYRGNPPTSLVRSATIITTRAIVAMAARRSGPPSSRVGSAADQEIFPRGYNKIRGPWNRCHLIAKSLGGSGLDGRNLFACPRYANDPVMKYYETRIRDYLKTAPSTARVRLDVNLTWKADQDYPTQIHMRAVDQTLSHGNFLLLEVWMLNTGITHMKVTINCLGTLTNSGKHRPRKLAPNRVTFTGGC